MAGGVTGDAGGIGGLLDDDRRLEAVEFKLIELGLRLRNVGEADLDWRDVLLVNASLGPDPAWSGTDLLLAAAVDALNLLVWQNTEDGSKGTNRPPRIPRPGVEEEEDDRVTTFGSSPVSIEEMNELLGWAPAGPVVADG